MAPLKTSICVSLLLCMSVLKSAWVDNYNTIWTEPGTTQWGSLPIGSGDLTANVWLNETTSNNYDLYFAFGHSNSYDLTAERLKMLQLKLSYNPPISNSQSNSFKEILYVSNATISIITLDYNILIWIDANSDNLYVETVSNNIDYTLQTEIISWRNKNNFDATGSTGNSFCYNPNIVPVLSDTILQHGCNNDNNELIFYHRNVYSTGQSQYEWQLNEQELGYLLKDLPDPYYNLTWGGLLKLNGNSKVIGTNTLQGNYTSSSMLTFNVLVEQTDTIDLWINALCNSQYKYESIKDLHQTWWDTFWNRSWVEINSTVADEIADTNLITLLYTHQRYLDALDGRSRHNKSMKFNGQSFYIDAGKGPDNKNWGSSYWWQNTRQPYYNTLVANDLDFNLPFYNQFLNQLTLIQARNQMYYNHSGGFYGETANFNGLYQEAGWGYNCHNGTKFDPFKMNSYIRFHWVGGLELINMMLDEYDFYLNDNIINQYILPISDVLLTHYIQHYSINSTDGKLDMFPAQSLETWQCSSATRANCVTNPTEQISGLMVVTKRLLNLPTNYGNKTQRELWQNIRNIAPNIPLIVSHGVNIISPGKLLPSHTSNSENTELYTVHPFRIFQWFKPNLTLANNTYKYRRFPCNDGWCQDVVDAAMLGMVDDAKSQVVSRAKKAKSGYAWKWDGFTAHFQDYEPSLDHLNFMRTAIHYMLIQNNFDTNEIYLLPTWPCEWSVRFKLNAKSNTNIILDYNGNGTVNQLIVEPQSRKNDVKFVRCVSS